MRPTSNAHVRFVANLSPESAFIINNHHLEGSDSISRHGVGLWLGQDEEVAVEAASANDQRHVLSVPTQVLDGLSGQTLLLSILRPALRRECLSVIPPEQELGLLFDLYYAKIDVIFPLLKDEPWEKHGTVETITLKQCICLVASSDPSMRPHLRLPHHDGVLSQMDFRARIFAAVKQTLDLGFIADKIVLLQVCTLMSMYTNDEDFGVLSTHYCAQAILYEQTLGFHVGWPDGKAGGERSRRIFWCVWVLDRLNAATNGRPTVMNTTDADKKVMDSIADQPPPFKLLIHLAELLEDTISLYRPGTMASTKKNKPRTFEELIEMASAQSLSGSLLASLELFYLSAVILQDRSSENQSSSELQGFYAMRIVAIASTQNISSLIYWPVLPYAVTVAASVAYRSLRRSATAYSRLRAFTLFQDTCKILDDLGETFLSARAMARLTRDTMQGVGRATERIRRDSIKALNSAGDPTAEAIVGENTQESRDANQPQSSQLSRTPQPLGAAPSASAAVYTQMGPDLFSGYTGDAEIFDNFDPSFDLGRADAIFSANLDLNTPYFADDWPVSAPYTRDVG
ncbi:unnamed protein product [Clonostachys rosea]|uniref:Xylanolytic transcriptional activator regulatory domain-containing protein n=1 Tax=Bionectria ochroleuca TaxID=29856 RepID=A0ABY6UMT6_BIOOC|nr:unnamed protein product [Clonostachys rosea]